MKSNTYRHTDQEDSQGDIQLCSGGWSEEWVIDMVSHIGSKAPIIGAVLEEVEEWHGAVREPMHELSLQQTLGIVEGPTAGSNAVKERFRLALRYESTA
ncbi:hypothetical protein E2C01_102756 [Portunus trituberculatus]|uniref:Uncharacterized protein n=1 Tax=Portunus trituberculatus TaxID=210409 RepID=A0A5B7KNI9_PORTR|nr:hypothetical protein [Portunus trituberculatus]